MKTRFAVLAAAVALAAPALAADTYQFDKSHTTVGFSVRHIVTNVGGKFQDFSGTIQVDKAKLESSSVEFTIQAASINTNEPKRDEHLKSPDFFDVENNPQITFVTKKIEPDGGDWKVTGDLTIRGITTEVVLDGEVTGPLKDPWGGSRIGLSLDGKVNRKDFGMVWNTALEAGGFLVGDDVKLNIEVELLRK